MTEAGHATDAEHGTCPECGRPATREHRPFCSARCRRVDLNRWLSNGYAIPGEAADPPEAAD